MTPPPVVFVTRSRKSMTVAVLLTLIFGPFGLFYASWVGGLVMSLTPLGFVALIILGFLEENDPLVILLLGLMFQFAFFYWFLCILWAALSVHHFNRRIELESLYSFHHWSNRQTTQPPVVVHVNTHATSSPTPPQEKPSMNEWLRANPGKSINDYYSKVGRRT